MTTLASAIMIVRFYILFLKLKYMTTLVWRSDLWPVV